MSYIRHKIVLTLLRTAPTLLVEQGFAGRCESAGTAGRRVFRGVPAQRIRQFHGLHASRSIPPGTPFRFRLTPIGHSIRAPLPVPRLATSSAVSNGRVAVGPKRNHGVLHVPPAPLSLEEKDSWHGSHAVTPMRRTSSGSPGRLRAIRAWHGRHVFINAWRIAHKMAFFPSVPRTVQESSQWLSPQSALP